ncbi:MAG TPA: conjugative transposon protein TraM [Flavisolibacter sp.]|nr:conjugative transposon protein TraM [Flavisolibacter sp.]
MQKEYSEKFLRKRKFLLILPFLTLPFVTLGFWSLGGGSGSQSNQMTATTGLNLELPDAKLVEQHMDKLSFYNQAQEDSVKHRLERQNDPYYKNGLDTLPIPVDMASLPGSQRNTGTLNTSPYTSSGRIEATEAKINERLEALGAVAKSGEKDERIATQQKEYSASAASSDVTKLEALMQSMNDKSGDDPELVELNGMLEKILDIQHPERVKEKLNAQATQKSISDTKKHPTMKAKQGTYFGNGGESQHSAHRFFGSSFTEPVSESTNTFRAVIQGEQMITSGAVVKLRLTEDAEIKGVSIPSGSLVYGVASLENERLQIEVKSLRFKNNVLPVSLLVYDLDGLSGIYVPGSESRDVMKNAADQSLQSIDIVSLDPSLKAQAASASVQTVKGLLSRKVKAVKVTLKTGYAVLLKNKTEN